MTVAVEKMLEVTKLGFALSDPDFDAVDDELDSIQSELMKKGSVAYYEIDWSQTFELSMKALQAGVHIDALAAGALAILQAGTDDDVAQLLPLLEVSLTENWEKIQPSAPKFDRLKKSRIQDIANAIPKRHQKEPIFTEGFQDALGKLLPVLKSTGLEVEALEAIYTPVNSPNTAEGEENFVQGTATAGAAQSTAATVAGAPENPYQADLDAKGRAQLKRDIASIAARIEAYRMSDPTPYYLRAFAATLDLKTAPQADENGVTEMNAMPSEISDPFEQGLAAPTQQLLAQIEQRLLNSPDWFEGQAMAVQFAESLGQSEAANAIRHRVHDRLLRIPELADLKYSNGKAYLPTDAKRRLEIDGSASSQKDGEGGEEQILAEQISTTFEIKGLEKALDLVEAKSKAAKTDRARAVLSILRAELLFEAGLGKLAADSIQDLAQKFENKELQNWDKKLYKRIQKILGQSEE